MSPACCTMIIWADDIGCATSKACTLHVWSAALHDRLPNCWLLLLHHDWDLHLSRMHSRCISKIICQCYCIHVGKLVLCSNATASFVYLEFQALKTHERVTMKVILRCWVSYEWAVYSACRIRMQLQHCMRDATWKNELFKCNYLSATIATIRI